MKQKTLIQKTEAELGIGDMLPVVLGLAVAGLGAAFTLDILGDVRDGMTASSAERNATQNVINGVAALPEKFPTIGTVVAAAVIIGVLLTAFGAFRGRR